MAHDAEYSRSCRPFCGVDVSLVRMVGYSSKATHAESANGNGRVALYSEMTVGAAITVYPALVLYCWEGDSLREICFQEGSDSRARTIRLVRPTGSTWGKRDGSYERLREIAAYNLIVFESICIRRQAIVGPPVDLGFVAQAMIFYGEAHLVAESRHVDLLAPYVRSRSPKGSYQRGVAETLVP